MLLGVERSQGSNEKEGGGGEAGKENNGTWYGNYVHILHRRSFGKYQFLIKFDMSKMQ